MSLEQGLNVLQHNYSIVSNVDNGNEVVVTTHARIMPVEAGQLTRLGWVIREYNVAVFTKGDGDAVVAKQLPPVLPSDTMAMAISALDSLGSDENPPPDQPDSTETE